MDYYVIAYDIRDNKRRAAIFKILKGYASPVQNSVFEGHITKKDFIKLKYGLKRQMNEKVDSICFYSICSRCRGELVRFGTKTVVFGKDDIII